MSDAIERGRLLRVQVREVLLEWLRSGKLQPGSSFTQSQLAEELGVSRTPLREALLRLEVEGFVESTDGKGFTVAPLRLETAEELYELVGYLESLALQLSPEPDSARLERLRSLDRERSRAKRARIVELGTRWHEQLIGECRNSQLLELLGLARERLYRFEYALMREPEEREISRRQHEAILEALEAGDPERAERLVREHWMHGLETISRMLANRRSEAGDA